MPDLDLRHGGPSRTVVALTNALASSGGVAVQLLSLTGSQAATLPSVSGVHRVDVAPKGGPGRALALPLRRVLADWPAGQSPHLVHSHGVWNPAGHWACRAARRWRVPLLIHPRGMLEPWALGQKALKKRLALWAFQRRDLRTAQALVATSAMEADNLRRFGLSQPIAVIPNGVALPHHTAIAPRDGAARHIRTALFLSRVHPKKGVRELVQAWAQVAPKGWRLVIAGPDEGGHWGEVARRVRGLGLDGVVEYVGEVGGEAKAALYAAADLFVLPTFSENFGVVVAEALAYDVPVITTHGAPWEDLQTHGCGWWIETGVEPLVSALRAAAALSDKERWAMGERGRVYVRRFDWGQVAEQTLALYRWILGQGERPDTVRLD